MFESHVFKKIDDGCVCDQRTQNFSLESGCFKGIIKFLTLYRSISLYD